MSNNKTPVKGALQWNEQRDKVLFRIASDSETVPSGKGLAVLFHTPPGEKQQVYYHSKLTKEDFNKKFNEVLEKLRRF